MSSVTHKRYSTIFSNIDANSYRAFRAAINSKNGEYKSSPKRSKSLSVDPLKNENNISGSSFALKSKRFQWQTDSFQNSVVQLNGDLKDYQNGKNNSLLNWDGLNTLNESKLPTFKQPEVLQKKMMKRLIENSSSSRTISPSNVINCIII
jgi:hypothetical protein